MIEFVLGILFIIVLQVIYHLFFKCKMIDTTAPPLEDHKEEYEKIKIGDMLKMKEKQDEVKNKTPDELVSDLDDGLQRSRDRRNKRESKGSK